MVQTQRIGISKTKTGASLELQTKFEKQTAK